MEFKITSNKENKLLERKEITFSVDQDTSTISREEITREICRKLSLDPESTIVVRIDQGFGSRESTGIAHSYSSRELLNRYEPKHVLSRMNKKSGKQDAGAAEKADEAPKEKKEANQKAGKDKKE